MATNLPDALYATPLPDPRCRFVKVNGARCRMRAKLGSDLCVDHHFKKTYTRGHVHPNPPALFNTVPVVRFAWAEDYDSILFNCNQIALALVHDTINARHAGALNALMRTAQRSLRQKFLHERFEARQSEQARERAAQAALQPPSQSSSHAFADPSDYVTDYVLDSDGMPLALPDPPVASSLSTPTLGEVRVESSLSSPATHENTAQTNSSNPSPVLSTEEAAPSPEPCVLSSTPGAPSLSSPGVGEDRVGSSLFPPADQENSAQPEPCTPSPVPPSNAQDESNPAWVARQRENIIYLREYFKNDPKMLAEIETYRAARYAPKPKWEADRLAALQQNPPQPGPIPSPAPDTALLEPAELATLTAAAEDPAPCSQSPGSRPLAPNSRLHRYSQPQQLPHIARRPHRSALFATHSKFASKIFQKGATGRTRIAPNEPEPEL